MRSILAMAFILLSACSEPAPPVEFALPFESLEQPVAGLLRGTLSRAEADPANLDARLELALALEANGLREEAVQAFADVVRMDPDQHLARYHQATNLLEIGRTDDARPLLEKASKDAPSIPAIDARLGVLLLDLGEYDRAKACFEHVLSAVPSVPHGELGLGRVALARGDAAGAIRHLEAAARIAPGEKIILFALGQAYQLSGREAEAGALLERGAGGQEIYLADPFLPRLDAVMRGRSAVLERATRLRTEGDFSSAIRLLSPLYASAAEDDVVANNYAGILIDGRMYTKAEQVLRKQLERTPNAAPALLNLSVLEQRREQSGPALDAAQRAVEAAPDLAAARRQFANLLASAERYPEAYDQFSALSGLEPGNVQTENMLAQCSLASDRYGRGVDHLRRSISLQPGDPSIHLNLIRTLARTGRPVEARQALEAMSRSLPGHPALIDAEDMIKAEANR